MLRWRWLELMCGAPPDTEKSTWGNTSDCWSGRGGRKVRKGGGAAMYLSACVRVGRGGAETAMLSYVGGGRAVGTADWEVLMVILMGHAVTCCPGGGPVPVLSRCLSPCSPGHGLTVRVTEYSLKKCRPLLPLFCRSSHSRRAVFGHFAPFLSRSPKAVAYTAFDVGPELPSHTPGRAETLVACVHRVCASAPDPPQNPGSSLATLGDSLARFFLLLPVQGNVRKKKSRDRGGGFNVRLGWLTWQKLC